jgi:YggT family protein
MVAILRFLYFIAHAAIDIAVFVVIAWAILSWLVAFDVINLRNRAVYQISRTLETMARPLLAPFQRFLPSPGGLDFSPIIFIILAEGVDRYLLPALFGWLISLVTPAPAAVI